jgi:hypothetical protein
MLTKRNLWILVFAAYASMDASCEIGGPKLACQVGEAIQGPIFAQTIRQLRDAQGTRQIGAICEGIPAQKYADLPGSATGDYLWSQTAESVGDSLAALEAMAGSPGTPLNVGLYARDQAFVPSWACRRHLSEEFAGTDGVTDAQWPQYRAKLKKRLPIYALWDEFYGYAEAARALCAAANEAKEIRAKTGREVDLAFLNRTLQLRDQWLASALGLQAEYRKTVIQEAQVAACSEPESAASE